MPRTRRIQGAELAGDALVVAERLLGAELVLGPVVLRIVEVEAYRWPGDTANHCRAGRTARNAPMWGPAGLAYVYLCYGIHHLLNVTCGAEGEGAAVLIRGAEVLAGHELVAERRGRTGPGSLAGPGKVAQALGIDRTWTGHDLTRPGGLELVVGSRRAERVLEGPRVGIAYASPSDQAAPWRLADAHSDQVSHRRSLGPRA